MSHWSLDPDIERSTLDAGSPMEGMPSPHLDQDGAVGIREQHPAFGRGPGRAVRDDWNEVPIFSTQDFSQKIPLVRQQTRVHW